MLLPDVLPPPPGSPSVTNHYRHKLVNFGNNMVCFIVQGKHGACFIFCVECVDRYRS
jgi:hypothetical protein